MKRAIWVPGILLLLHWFETSINETSASYNFVFLITFIAIILSDEFTVN